MEAGEETPTYGGSAAPSVPASLLPIPRMSVVILVVGTRGDVAPFCALGKQLVASGHRVRLATHVDYRKDVAAAGLEYYPLAGDPKTLSMWMVKAGGRLIPSTSEEIAVVPAKMKMLR